MPSKSRHSHRKKSFKASKKATPVTPVSVEQKPVTGEQYKPDITSRAVSPGRKTAPAVVMQYPFIKKELAWIGILAAIIFIILVIVYYIL